MTTATEIKLKPTTYDANRLEGPLMSLDFTAIGETVVLTAQIVEHKAEQGFPRLVEVVVDVNGDSLELTPDRARALALLLHRFADQLPILADTVDLIGGQ